MAELTIEEQLENIAQQMNKAGKRMMKHKSELYKLRGTEIRVAGAMIREWTGAIKKDDTHGLEESSNTTDETVREETADKVEESE